ncbi:MAG: sulfatase-like hydrolase/transferase [Alphaproteobacteria bacterium]|nr:sulfatase-like hydrolase/transferase [Alphaproteobacteria bacterium]
MAPMRLRRGMTAAILGAGLALLAACGPGADEAAKAPPAPEQAAAAGAGRPNVVVIIADDLGWADVSTYGLDRVPTPNIDRIAKDGVAFSNGYVVAPVCTVSRSGLLTGRYPQRFGIEYLNMDDEINLGLPVSETTIADRLKKAGYHTGLVGKWHQGGTDEFYPTNRGFDEFYGILGGMTTYIDPATPGIVDATPGRAPKTAPKREGPQLLLKGPDREEVHNFDKYLTYELTDQANDFVARNKNDPFFLYLAYTAPHRPFQVPQEVYDRFPNIADHGRRTYVAMIAALDDSIGRFLDTLEAEGVRDNTLVVFLSDNGCPPQFESCDCSHPINAGKFTLLEGGIRVPFLLSWPKGLAARGRIDEPVSALDILPTALKAAGIAPPTDETLDGSDLVAIAQKPQGEDERSFVWRTLPAYAVREGRWKLWTSIDLNRTELFDLEADPGETADVAADHPEIVARLRARFDDWSKGASEPLWPVHHKEEVEVCGRVTEFIY